MNYLVQGLGYAMSRDSSFKSRLCCESPVILVLMKIGARTISASLATMGSTTPSTQWVLKQEISDFAVLVSLPMTI